MAGGPHLRIVYWWILASLPGLSGVPQTHLSNSNNRSCDRFRACSSQHAAQHPLAARYGAGVTPPPLAEAGTTNAAATPTGSEAVATGMPTAHARTKRSMSGLTTPGASSCGQCPMPGSGTNSVTHAAPDSRLRPSSMLSHGSSSPHNMLTGTGQLASNSSGSGPPL
eukprot:365122-Chlamydomonas_euryale.AAC.16